MRQWRVGSMSMGVLLVSFGVLLLAALIQQASVINHILSLWPVVLIILGAEIIVYLFLSKEEHPRIKYDVMSIFLIFVIGVFSLGLYAVSSIGVIPRVTAAIASQEFSVAAPDTKIEVSSSVEKIEFDLPKAQVSFKKGEADRLIIFAKGQVVAESMEMAEELAAQGKVNSAQIGDVLYVQIFDVPAPKGFNPTNADFSYTVFLPENKEIEIKRQHYANSHYYRPVEIEGEAVSKLFTVDNYGSVKLKVDSQSDLEVNAVVDDQSYLSGNVEWNSSTQPDTNKTVGNVSLGEGLHKVNIMNQGNVEVVFFE